MITNGQTNDPPIYSGGAAAVYPPTLGTSYTTSWGDATGFTAGNLYNGYGYAQAANGSWYNAGSVSFRTKPPNLTGLSGYSGVSNGNPYVRLSWAQANGATQYSITWTGTYSGSASVGAQSSADIVDTIVFGGTYYFTVTPINASGSGGSQTTNGIFVSIPLPSGTPFVSLSASSNRTINASWTAVTYATNYKVTYQRTGITETTADNTASTSVSFQVDAEYKQYTIKVTPQNSSGSGTPDSKTVWSLDETAPSINTFFVTEELANEITVYSSGNDSGSGIAEYRFYQDGSYRGKTVGSGGVYFTYKDLTPNHTYTLDVRAVDQVNLLSPETGITKIYGKTKYARPQNFEWLSPKTSGESFSLTAYEWNQFTARIDLFRQYKGLNAYGFTTITPNTPVYAWIFNQAVNGLSGLAGYMGTNAIPPEKNTGDSIQASLFTNMVLSLNSIP